MFDIHQHDPFKDASQDAQIEHLTKVVRVLWHQVEHLRRYVSVDSNQIVVRSGSASIVLKKDGTIVIRGHNVAVEGMGRIDVKAAGNLVLKGANIQQN